MKSIAKIAPSFSFARLLANVGFTALSYYIARASFYGGVMKSMAKIVPSFSFARLLANVGFTALSHYIAKVLKKVNF